MAAIDRYGTCLISVVNTDNYRFHLNMEMKHPRGKQSISIIFKFFSPALTRQLCFPHNNLFERLKFLDCLLSRYIRSLQMEH